MTEKTNDPAELWRHFIGEMEKGFNSFANQATASPEFSRMVNQASGVAAGAQKQFGELMEKWLLATNLPSRAQMIGIAERLQAVESQIAEVKTLLLQMQQDQGSATAQSPAAIAKPPRTKRPPSAPPGEKK